MWTGHKTFVPSEITFLTRLSCVRVLLMSCIISNAMHACVRCTQIKDSVSTMLSQRKACPCPTSCAFALLRIQITSFWLHIELNTCREQTDTPHQMQFAPSMLAALHWQAFPQEIYQMFAIYLPGNLTISDRKMAWPFMYYITFMSWSCFLEFQWRFQPGFINGLTCRSFRLSRIVEKCG